MKPIKCSEQLSFCEHHSQWLKHVLDDNTKHLVVSRDIGKSHAVLMEGFHSILSGKRVRIVGENCLNTIHKYQLMLSDYSNVALKYEHDREQQWCDAWIESVK